MFNKEKSNERKKVSVLSQNYKRAGIILLSSSLAMAFSSSANAEHTDCDHGQVEYYRRVYYYGQERQYDRGVKRLYEEGSIRLNGELLPIKKFFLTYKSNGDNRGYHLISVLNDYTDILLKSNDKYDYDKVVRFRDTTAFINLINSDAVIINGTEITIIDIDKAILIIEHWDGLIHDEVVETDAVGNKDLLRRIP